jgi:hypothetical protein
MHFHFPLFAEPSEFACMGPLRCSQRNLLRAAVYNIVHSTAFEVFVTLVIVMSSILLAFDDYQASLDDHLWIAVMDFVFAILFCEWHPPPPFPFFLGGVLYTVCLCLRGALCNARLHFHAPCCKRSYRNEYENGRPGRPALPQ